MHNYISAARRFVRSLKADTLGANMVEYLIVVGLVALAAMAGFETFGKETKGAVDAQASQVKGLAGGKK